MEDLREDRKSHSVKLSAQPAAKADAVQPPPYTQAPVSPAPKAPLKVLSDPDKIAYLTFDDGPSNNVTPLILDILKKYDLKATFFVLGCMVADNKSILEREYTEGHTIANHTYCHKYDYLYASPQNLESDIIKCDEEIKSVIPGYKGSLFRFPGGSFDKGKAYKDVVAKLGYSFIDWNCLSGDSEGLTIPSQKLIDEFKETAAGKKSLIILMHDSSTKATTPEALPAIIDFLRSKGYVFKTLS